MGDNREKVRHGIAFLEEAILDVLREEYPGALRATEIRDTLGIEEPKRSGFRNAMVDSFIKRLAERGCVEQLGDRGPWRLAKGID